MPRLSRATQRVALAVVMLLASALLAVVVLVDPAAHKSRIEEAASRVLGMDVTVNGPMALRWRPTVYLVLRDVRARKAGADVLVAEEVVLGLSMASLLGGQPQVRSVALHDGTLAIVRDANGRINLIKDPVPGRPRPALNQNAGFAEGCELKLRVEVEVTVEESRATSLTVIRIYANNRREERRGTDARG